METIAEKTRISHEEYHMNFSRDSASSLALFRHSIPKYAAIRIFRTMEPDEPTPEMVLGSAFHALVLEPETFSERYAVLPDVDRRTKEGKAAMAQWQADNMDKVPLDARQQELIENMANAVLDNNRARAAIQAAGSVEEIFLWDDQATGLPLKMRVDKILDAGVIIDLKTTDNVAPEAFAKSVFNFGYFRQCALYLDGFKASQGIDADFIFIAVSKSRLPEVACYVLDDTAIAMGRQDNAETIGELAERIRQGNWTGRWSDEIRTLSLPRWAIKVN